MVMVPPETDYLAGLVSYLEKHRSNEASARFYGVLCLLKGHLDPALRSYEDLPVDASNSSLGVNTFGGGPLFVWLPPFYSFIDIKFFVTH